MLDALLGAGIKYLFVSNSDNLGATLDLGLLGWFAGSGKAFVMEVGRGTGRGQAGGRGGWQEEAKISAWVAREAGGGGAGGRE